MILELSLQYAHNKILKVRCNKYAHSNPTTKIQSLNNNPPVKIQCTHNLLSELRDYYEKIVLWDHYEKIVMWDYYK